MIDHGRGKQTWEGSPINVSGSGERVCILVMCEHKYTGVCVYKYTRVQLICIQPEKLHAYLWWICAWLCAFLHLRKDNVQHSTRERSHYQSRNSSLEATVLHVVWIDGVSFSLRRAVEHTFCHYQCPAVQTLLLLYFSWKKVKLTKTNKCFTIEDYRYKFRKCLNN